MPDERKQANEETREAWNENAAFWDERIGEGNDFVNVLIWPATERLLALRPGERVLDAGCGNGLYARRLAAMGAEVVAFDFAAAMIDRARTYLPPETGRITYRVLDATDEGALAALVEDERPFDAAICQMALFDMAEIAPLMRTLARLIRPGGRLVWAVMHPCFNSPHTSFLAERQEREGRTVTSYALKVSRYLDSTVERGEAIVGQPSTQLYFHRPLQALFGACFEAGFVLDALEERAFPPDHPPGRDPLSWGANFSEIPPVLVARMRPARARDAQNQAPRRGGAGVKNRIYRYIARLFAPAPRRGGTMKQVYLAQDPVEAYFVKGLLEAEGIAALVRGEYLFAVRGAVPVTYPTVWADDADEERARAIVAEYERVQRSPLPQGARWQCPQCGEILDGQFSACWRCGAERPEEGLQT